MGFSKFFSTFALVSLFISLHGVAALPHDGGHHHHHHHERPTTTEIAGPPEVSSTEAPVVPIATVTEPAGTPAAGTHRGHTSKSTTAASPQSPTISSGTSAPTATSVPGGSSGTYSLLKDFCGNSFFNEFNFYTGPDPTHGFVEYGP
jgi:hypothetical protein